MLLQYGGFGATHVSGLWPFQSKGIRYVIICVPSSAWRMAATSLQSTMLRAAPNACREGQKQRQEEDTCLDV